MFSQESPTMKTAHHRQSLEHTPPHCISLHPDSGSVRIVGLCILCRLLGFGRGPRTSSRAADDAHKLINAVLLHIEVLEGTDQ